MTHHGMVWSVIALLLTAGLLAVEQTTAMADGDTVCATQPRPSVAAPQIGLQLVPDDTSRSTNAQLSCDAAL